MECLVGYVERRERLVVNVLDLLADGTHDVVMRGEVRIVTRAFTPPCGDIGGLPVKPEPRRSRPGWRNQTQARIPALRPVSSGISGHRLDK